MTASMYEHESILHNHGYELHHNLFIDTLFACKEGKEGIPIPREYLEMPMDIFELWVSNPTKTFLSERQWNTLSEEDKTYHILCGTYIWFEEVKPTKNKKWYQIWK